MPIAFMRYSLIENFYFDEAKNSSIYSGIVSFKIVSASLLNSFVERIISPNEGFEVLTYLRKPIKNSRTDSTGIESKYPFVPA